MRASRYQQVSTGRPTAWLGPVLLAVTMLLTCLTGADGTSIAAVAAPSAAVQHSASETGEPRVAVHGDGESGRGSETGDQATTRARSKDRQPIARPLLQRGLLSAVTVVRDLGVDLAAHPAPPPGPRARHAGRAPGARLLIALRISRI